MSERKQVVVIPVNINAQDHEGKTPLHWAALNGHVKVVRCLVKECGANPYVRDYYGKSALDYASENGHLEVVKCLTKECGVQLNPT